MGQSETLFHVYCEDGPGAAALREKYLAAHLAYVEAHMAAYRAAGPLRDGSGAYSGSVFIVSAADEAAARALMDGDPYFSSGMYARVRIAAFRAAAGTWVGGRNW